MKNKIILLSFLFIFLFILMSFGLIAAQAGEQVFSVEDSVGKWEKVDIDGQPAIAADEKHIEQHISIDIPENGDYKIYLNIFHSWQKYCPFIYFEVVDSKGKKFDGHVFSEHRWYLEKGRGRWEYRSLSPKPFLSLHKGKAKITVWLDARQECWVKKPVPIQGKLYIKELILLEVGKNPINHKNPGHKEQESVPVWDSNSG
jgi:hypothetical protein